MHKASVGDLGRVSRLARKTPKAGQAKPSFCFSYLGLAGVSPSHSYFTLRPIFRVPSLHHLLPPLSRGTDSAMLMHREINFKDLLHWRLEWRWDSEYRGYSACTLLQRHNLRQRIEIMPRVKHKSLFQNACASTSVFVALVEG